MALLKLLKIGEELKFDLKEIGPDAARKGVSITLVEKSGRVAVLKISSDRSIPIAHVKLQRLPA